MKSNTANNNNNRNNYNNNTNNNSNTNNNKPPSNRSWSSIAGAPQSSPAAQQGGKKNTNNNTSNNNSNTQQPPQEKPHQPAPQQPTPQAPAAAVAAAKLANSPSPPNAANKAALQQIHELIQELPEVDRKCNRSAFLHLLQSMAGKEVQIELADGTALTGIFHTSTLFQQYPQKELIIKACKVTTPGTSGKTFEDGSTVILDYNKVVSINATLGDLYARSFSSDFRTDASIKKRGDMSYLQGRDLQGVSDAWLDPSMSTGLLDGQGGGGGAPNLSLTGGNNNNKDWDQFETNRVLFNVRSTYDENLYTKKLDYNALTPEQIARAERLAKEIEKQTSSNIHLLEERGHVLERDIDEEARFSGVIRSDYSVDLQVTSTTTVSGGNSTPSSSKESGNWRQNNNKQAEDKWQRGVGKTTPKNQQQQHKDTLPPSHIVSPAAAAAAINPLELPAGLSPTNRSANNNNSIANYNPPKGHGDLQGPPQLKFGTVDTTTAAGQGKVIIPTSAPAAHHHSVSIESTTIASFNNLTLEKTTTTTTTTTDATVTKPIPGLVPAAVEIHKTTALEESHSTTLFDAQGKAIAGTKETVTTTVSDDKTLTKSLSSNSSSKLNVFAKSWTPTLPPPPVSLPSTSSSVTSPIVPPSPVASAASSMTPVTPVVTHHQPPPMVPTHAPVVPPHPQLHTPTSYPPVPAAVPQASHHTPSHVHTPSSHSNASHGHHGNSNTGGSHGHGHANTSHSNVNSNSNTHANPSSSSHHHINSPHMHPSTPSNIPVTPVLQPPMPNSAVSSHGNYESPSMSRINSSNAIRNSPSIQALSSPAMNGSPSTLPPTMAAAAAAQQQIPSMTIPPQSPYGASPMMATASPQYNMDPNAYYQQQHAQQYVYRAQENGGMLQNSFFYDPYTAQYNYYAANVAAYGGYPGMTQVAYQQPTSVATAGYPQGYAMDPNALAMYSQMNPAAYAQAGAYGYAPQQHMGQPMMMQGAGPGVAGGQGQGGPRNNYNKGPKGNNPRTPGTGGSGGPRRHPAYNSGNPTRHDSSSSAAVDLSPHLGGMDGGDGVDVSQGGEDN